MAERPSLIKDKQILLFRFYLSLKFTKLQQQQQQNMKMMRKNDIFSQIT